MLRPDTLNKIVILILLIIFSFEMILASAVENLGMNNLRSLNQTISPRLLFRYETGTSMFKVSDDFRLHTPPSSYEKLGEVIAIRVCSNKKLLPAIPSTTINPMQIASYLTGSGFESSNIFLLSSKDCIVPARDNLYPVEIWNLEKGSELPPNNENYNYGQIRYLSFGFDPLECKRIDTKKSANELIKKLLNDKNSFGIIISYYLEKPSLILTKRVKIIENLLKKNNIPSSRYSITKQYWHDGDSACNEKEPTQPMVIFITLNKQ